MMIVGTFRSSDRPLDQDELIFRRQALRDAVLCIGWLKFTSVFCLIGLYILVYINSKGHMSTVLQILILVMIPLEVINGMLLFLGALEEKILALELALWLCIVLAAYNTVLGVLGCVYFIRKGHLTVHFMLAIIFACQTCSLITTICRDLLIVFTYKQNLETTQDVVNASNKVTKV